MCIINSNPHFKSTEKKLTTITTKVSPEEKNMIQEKAGKARLTVSAYMRSTAMGLQFVPILSPKEFQLLNNLDGCRSDLLKFMSALHGMKNDKRKELFQHLPYMIEWYKQVEPITNAIIEFLNSIYNLYGGTFKKASNRNNL